MSLITIFILAVGLGVDAFSVAIGIGAANDKKSWAPTLRLSAAFGIFQFVMPIVGWLAGLTVVEIIASFDHWIAFSLLALVGGKMIWEGLEKESDEEKNGSNARLATVSAFHCHQHRCAGRGIQLFHSEKSDYFSGGNYRHRLLCYDDSRHDLWQSIGKNIW